MASLPITSHITHLGQEAEGCQVSLSAHLSQTGATASAWNFKSAGARPFWEKEEAPPIHNPSWEPLGYLGDLRGRFSASPSTGGETQTQRRRS